MSIVSGPRALLGSPRHLAPDARSLPEHLVAKLSQTSARYVRETLRPPRESLVVLRVLCERGRAEPPPGLLTRLFSTNCMTSDAKRKTRAVVLPDGPFRLILAFWIQPLVF